jgi:hypothetical protein
LCCVDCSAPRFEHVAEEASGHTSISQQNVKERLCAASSSSRAPNVHPQTAAARVDGMQRNCATIAAQRARAFVAQLPIDVQMPASSMPEPHIQQLRHCPLLLRPQGRAAQSRTSYVSN